MSEDAPKRTSLYDDHLKLGARMVPFAGYDMPVQYPAGIIAEHMAVRERAGLFDVSHMGQIEIAGEQALEAVQLVASNDASRLQPGQVPPIPRKTPGDAAGGSPCDAARIHTDICNGICLDLTT